ncbi:MAG: GtrA family protein [Peptoanaerobacter stomatis]|uniref:GtrA family protein n=1 Tax=Peptoanaerobacter stomatis TaxID=796937 RepID=UPI003F9FEEC9
MLNRVFYKYKELILYGFFGVLTVIVNIISFKLLLILNTPLLYANTVAFFIAVLFAYYTNTKYVFNDKFTKKNFISFISMRVGTLFIDNIMLYYLVSMSVDELIAKSIINIIIILINYICSKFIIFKKN